MWTVAFKLYSLFFGSFIKLQSSQEVVATKVSSSSSSSSSLPKSYSPASLCSFESFGRLAFDRGELRSNGGPQAGPTYIGSILLQGWQVKPEVKDFMLHMNNG
ncbi:unnamed protein product [Musa acuminata subsp. burmannicoides]